MIYVAEFEKVSFEQFKKDCENVGFKYTDTIYKNIYDSIKLPTRATTGSAGYDFYSPFNVLLKSTEGTMIPTGIRCKIDEDWVLMVYPKSGLGCKYGVSLANTVGIIDSDYYHSDNEGHIMLKLNTKETYPVNTGDKIIQGVFTHYGITVNDNATDKRNGGFGSTGK